MYIIYGAGNAGRKAEERIKTEYNEDVSGYFDTYKNGEFNQKPIIPINLANKEASIIIAHDSPSAMVDMYEILISNGYRNIFWFLNMDNIAKEKTNFLNDECVFAGNWGDCVLPDLEVHIANNCNLNCKGCTHFSPLFSEVGVEYNSCLDGIKKLRSKVSNIARLDILGGEPLLNKELVRYVVGIREILPDTRINIFTNGILILTLSDETLTMVKNSRVGFMISIYPPTEKLIEKITKKLESHKLRYKLTPMRGEFVIPISTSKKSKYPNTCISNGCVSIADGKIARCPTLLYINRFNEVFNEHLPEDGIYDLDRCPSGNELRTSLQQTVPLCKHCIMKEIKWEPCGHILKREFFSVQD